jgi:hypothetical protein
MAKYGYCEDCGCTLEAVGCPNCNEVEVNEYLNHLLGIDKEDDE